MPDFAERQKQHIFLRDDGFQFTPLEGQGRPFERPLSYLSVSILEPNKPADEISEIIVNI